MKIKIEKINQEAFTENELVALKPYNITDTTRYDFQKCGGIEKYLYTYTIDLHSLDELIALYKIIQADLILGQNILGDLVITIANKELSICY
jgi:hypothetical protein